MIKKEQIDSLVKSIIDSSNKRFIDKLINGCNEPHIYVPDRIKKTPIKLKLDKIYEKQVLTPDDRNQIRALKHQEKELKKKMRESKHE